MCTICAVVDAMCNFPNDQSMQYTTVDMLHSICKKRGAPNFNIHRSTHYATAYILAAMLMFPEDEEFQVRNRSSERDNGFELGLAATAHFMGL